MSKITFEDYLKVDIRTGTIIKVEDFPKARNPAYILHVDFGAEIGIKKSSAQITNLYTKEELLDKKILGVVNFHPKQVGTIMSECLVVGFYRNNESVVLAVPDLEIGNGSRLL
ncbi:MAG: tRNA-binding protein [PS1 clade bacterium]|jgi:tRNA-binding protein